MDDPNAIVIVSPAGGTTGVGRRCRDGMSLADKLRPDRFTEMSGRMAAIVGYILDEAWTEPAIIALSVTSDGFVTTDAEFLGEAADLDRNLLNLLVAAGLTDDERADFGPSEGGCCLMAAKPGERGERGRLPFSARPRPLIRDSGRLIVRGRIWHCPLVGATRPRCGLRRPVTDDEDRARCVLEDIAGDTAQD